MNYQVKGKSIAIVADLLMCTERGNAIYDGETDERNLLRAYSEYRRIEGILGPDEIGEIRAKYGLSQRGLAAVLGWSPSTVARYEGGAIASVAHNEQIKRFRDDPSYARDLIQSCKPSLNRLEARRVSESLKALNDSPRRGVAVDHLLAFIEERYSSVDQGIYRGNTSFDIDKLTNVVAFFAQKCKGAVAKSKMLKLLWFADFLSVKRSGRSITGTVYCHNLFGPIPASHDWLLAYLKDTGAIEIEPYGGSYEGENIVAKTEFDSTMFSPDELKVLEDVCKRFRSSTAKTMTDVTHAEDAYAATKMNSLIPYTYAASLKALR